MMKKLIVTTLIFWFGSVHASTVTYQITQVFSEGATATALIVGDDINGDGRLLSDGDQNEVEAWGITFTGNSIVPPIDIPSSGNIPFIDLSLFPTEGSISEVPVPLAPDEFSQAAPGDFHWFVLHCITPAGLTCTGEIVERNIVGFPVDYSFEAPQVSILQTPVPAPPVVWLLASGLLGLVSLRHRKKQG
jgi:hypothetical protein